MKYFFHVILLLFIANISKGQNLELYFYDSHSGRPISDVLCIVDSDRIYFSSAAGFILINHVNNPVNIKVEHVSYLDTVVVASMSNDSLVIFLYPTSKLLGPINLKVNANIRTSPGKLIVGKQAIQNHYSVLGTQDPIDFIQSFAGVGNSQEGNVGLNIRGATTFENQITLDGAILYKTEHLFGLVSIFHANAISSITLETSCIDAQYGNFSGGAIRIQSSVGNYKEPSSSLQLGFLSSSILNQGPIIKDKASYSVAFRVGHPSIVAAVSNIQSTFYDVHTSIGFRLNPKSFLKLAYIYSYDKYTLPELKNLSLFSDANLWKNSALSLSSNTFWKGCSFDLNSSISSIDLDRMSYKQLGQKLNIINGTLKANKSTKRINGTIGFSFFRTSNVSIIDSFQLSNKQFIISPFASSKFTIYGFNFSVGYRMNLVHNSQSPFSLNGEVRAKILRKTDQGSIYIAFDQLAQSFMVFSESFIQFPSDFWVPFSSANDFIFGDQTSLGYLLESNFFNLSLATYIRSYQKYYDFRDGAVLYDNFEFNEDILNVNKATYGVDLSLFFEFKRFDLNINYTYGRTKMTGQGINNGKSYRAPFDRGNIISIEMKRISIGKWKFGANFRLSGGRRTTLQPPNPQLYFYPLPRNAVQYPIYHRLDVNGKREFHHKNGSKSELNISVYNVYNRLNPYYIILDSHSSTGYSQFALFPIIPSLNYNLFF